MATPINKAYSPQRVVGSGPAMSKPVPIATAKPKFGGDPGFSKTLPGPNPDPGILKTYPGRNVDPGFSVKTLPSKPTPKPKRIG
jgi:hypothetical protein